MELRGGASAPLRFAHGQHIQRLPVAPRIPSAAAKYSVWMASRSGPPHRGTSYRPTAHLEPNSLQAAAATATASTLHAQTHTHYTVRGAQFTTIYPDDQSSVWVTVTVRVVEAREASPSVTSHWGIGVYAPANYHSHMFYLTTEEWTIHWDEFRGILTFYKDAPGSPAVYHSLMVHDSTAFSTLTNYCVNARMYMYTGSMPT
ncbi:hypothetical protein OH77DRAFT_1580428 [Trametes cingulata]|nr:hypothetical protein OH77DRAFT_1580428 [Trametes cingulata]